MKYKLTFIFCTMFFQYISTNYNAFENNCFEKYYGLKFGTIKKMFPLEDNKKSIIPFFNNIIPPTISSKSSLILFAEKDMGKTVLWNYLKKNILLEEKVWVIEPLKKPYILQTALTNFITGQKNNNLSNISLNMRNWQEKNMIKLIILQMVYTILDNFNDLNICNLNQNDLDKLSHIIYLYSPKNFDRFVRMLEEKQTSWTHFMGLDRILKHITIESKSKYNSDFALDSYGYYKNVTFDISTLMLDDSTQNLNNIFEFEEKFYGPSISLIESPFELKPHWIDSKLDSWNIQAIFNDCIKIIKKAGINLVVAFDGFNELSFLKCTNQEFYNNILAKITKSMKPLLNAAVVRDLRLFVFIRSDRDVDGRILSNLSTAGKILVYKLNWTTEALYAYANFVFDTLKKQKINYINCNLPKSFSELLGGDACVQLFLSKISTPVKFNDLFLKFIHQLEIEGAEKYDHLRQQGRFCPPEVSPLFIGDRSCFAIEKII